MESSEKSSKLKFIEKAGFGLGDTASCLVWQTISLYLLFFYTDVFGLEAVAAGFMIMLLRSLDAIIDPIVGMIADRTKTRWGKFRPYLIWFSIPLFITVVATFSTPDFSSSGKLVYAYITYGLMMIMYSIINIPYSSMLGVLTSDPMERTSLSSFKFIGAYVGGLIISAALLPVAKSVGGSNVAHGWQVSMLIFGSIAVVLYFFTFILTKERVQPMPSQKTSIKKDLKDLFTNYPWVLLLFISLSMILFVASRLNITTYYFKYYVGKQILWGKEFGFEEMASAFNTLGMIFAILGVMVVTWVAKRLGKKNTFLLYFIIACVSTGAYYFLSPQDILLMFILQVIGSFVGGPLSTLIWAMYADTADYSEWKNNRRATGLVFSAAIMAQKFGWAIGTAFTGWLLTKFGFSPNMEQNADVKNLICLLMSLIPIGAGIISIILTLFYNLDDKKMKSIEKDLIERREKEGIVSN
jgi:GPH family glycoside/pentoside/hexuronide:cation symporter